MKAAAALSGIALLPTINSAAKQMAPMNLILSKDSIFNRVLSVIIDMSKLYVPGACQNMAKIKRGRNLKDFQSQQSSADVGKLRIIGGQFRGRQIQYSGDPVTRPMKDLTREACFNLVGGYMEGKAVFDLFAGTGAIGLEAVSRGATFSFLIERHIPTVRIVESNVQQLEVESKTEVVYSDTFFWVKQFLGSPEKWPSEPWAVFCCPPYALFETERDQLLITLYSMVDVAPPGSIFLVESDSRFDTSDLPDSLSWQTKHYAPAYISIAHKPVPDSADSDSDSSGE